MSVTFREAPFEKQRILIEGWKKELEFYESEIRSCQWSLDQFIPELTISHLQLAATRFQDKFKKQRSIMVSLQTKLSKHQSELESSGESDTLSEKFEPLFEMLNQEVDDCRQGFKGVLPKFDNFLRSCEAS